MCPWLETIAVALITRLYLRRLIRHPEMKVLAVL
jgi:hypothetical protein